MKVAILLVGRIYGYEMNIDLLKRMQEEHKVTFFCSLNSTLYHEHMQQFRAEFDITDECFLLQETPQDEYIKVTKPELGLTLNSNAYSQFYHMNHAWELLDQYCKKHETHFDIICKFRADLIAKEPFKFEKIEPNYIYIPSAEQWLPVVSAWYDYGVNDQIAYGPPEVMKKYCMILNHLSELLDTMDKLKHIPECVLKYYLNKEGVSIDIVQFLYDLNPKRYESPV